jgi:sec-independent protein translocase protein TatC
MSNDPAPNDQPGDYHERYEEKRLPFTEHLRELRTRTLRIVLYVVAGFGIGWAFHESLFLWLMEPYLDAIGAFDEDATGISFRSLIEPVVVYLKTALVFGALVAMPAVLTELWLFVAPGLYKNERRLAFPFLLASIVFFTGGAAFCRYVVLAPANFVLLGFGGDHATPVIMMEEYFSFTARLLFVFGALFELPVVVSFLSMVGILDHRFLIKHWRIALVAAFVIGAVLTPPDPLTQIALAVPLVILYGLSIVLAWMISRKRVEAAEAAELSDDASAASGEVQK